MIRNGPLPTIVIEYLTPYQRNTIKVAIEIYNGLPLCRCGSKHVMPGNPNIQDHELLILADAAAILKEWDVEPENVPGRRGKIKVKGI